LWLNSPTHDRRDQAAQQRADQRHDHVFNKQTEKLKTLKEKIANLYEPVQRICTIESERTEELG
jgi:hypothetical protein